MKDYHNQHDFCLRHRRITWYCFLLADFSIYFAIIVLKNLQNHLPIQNISVTLSSVIKVIFACNSLYFRVTIIFASYQLYKDL
nr:MAG TPA: hypothetical protein [Caudoviricetes sp.]